MENEHFNFPPEYSISGYIFKPSMELRKPFTFYNDAKRNQSRLDWYQGEEKMLITGGYHYKVFWTTLGETHMPEETCSRSPADAEGFPIATELHLARYKFVRNEPCDTDTVTIYSSVVLRNQTCHRYEDARGRQVLWVSM